MTDPLIGKQLGDYIIQELLGRGGMARVYKGYDDRLQRYAAVKVINSDFSTADQAEYAERFRREARSIARLHHPNIVGVYQFGEYEGNYYMAMVFIEGEDLRQILKRNAEDGASLDYVEVLNVVRGIGAALDYAHGRGVIHRDIKPSNIMLDNENRAILTDFGLALNTTEGTLGDTFGSAHYIAPEQAVSSAKSVPQSDLYSLGVCLYEMLAGKVPFDDPSAMSVALKHLNDAPPSPRQFNPALSPAIERVILKVLDKDPNQRYATGALLTSALEAAMEGRNDAQAGESASKSTGTFAAAGQVDARKLAAEAHETRMQELKTNDKLASSTSLPKVTSGSATSSSTSPTTKPQTPGVSEDSKPTLPPEMVDLRQAIMTDANADTDSPAPRSRLPLVLAAIVIFLIVAGGLVLASGASKGGTSISTPIGSASSVTGIAAAGTEESTAAVVAVEVTSTGNDSTSVATESLSPIVTEPAIAPSEIPTDLQTSPSAATPSEVAVDAGTAAPLTPTEQGDAATAQTTTVSGIFMTYDDTQFVLVNTSGHPIDIAKMKFIQQADSNGASRTFDTQFWYGGSQYTPDSLPSKFCFQTYRNDVRAQPVPIQPCQTSPINFRAAWAKAADVQRFWIAASASTTTFDVVLNNKTLTTCIISAGRCELSLP